MPTSLSHGHLSAHARPRVTFNSLPVATTGPAFLAAGWTVDSAVPHAALSSHKAAIMRAHARLVIEFGQPDREALSTMNHAAMQIPIALAMPHCTSVQIVLAASDRAREMAGFYQMLALSFPAVSGMVSFLSSQAGQAFLIDTARVAIAGATARIHVEAAPS